MPIFKPDIPDFPPMGMPMEAMGLPAEDMPLPAGKSAQNTMNPSGTDPTYYGQDIRPEGYRTPDQLQSRIDMEREREQAKRWRPEIGRKFTPGSSSSLLDRGTTQKEMDDITYGINTGEISYDDLIRASQSDIFANQNMRGMTQAAAAEWIRKYGQGVSRGSVGDRRGGVQPWGQGMTGR